MIVSASYRTDIPAFYGSWFMNRLNDGVCRVASPYGGKDYTVSLRRDDVDGFVFWSKNVDPFLAPLAEIRRRGFPFVVHYTVTGYPVALEQSVPETEQSVKTFKTLAKLYGKRAIVWRYDPIVATDRTTPDWHVVNFDRLAGALRGATDEVVVSFAHIYRKTRRNLDLAAERHGFAWHDPDVAEKETLAKRLAEIAADHGMRLTLCSQPALLTDGTEGARCIDAGRLSDVAGRHINARTSGNRPGCLCAESRDIGAYDTCPMGCAYCYAVSGRTTAQTRRQDHSESGTSLMP